MTRKRKRTIVPSSTPQSAQPAETAPRGRYDWKQAFFEYLSAGLGLRANLILGSIALCGLALFVQSSIWGPDIGDDNGDAPPGPTVFPTGTPAP